MQLQRVTSTTINAIGYDAVNAKMVIHFKDNSLYEYENVPFGVFNQLFNSPSKGSLLNLLTKRFKYKKLS